MEGWIKLHRKLQNHWLWQEKPFDKRSAWIDMLLLANHDDNKFLLGTTLVEVERGSFITSELKLMERWGWSKTKVRSFLELLENDKMIIKKSDKKKTTIIIENYSDYQDSETTERPQKDHKKTTERPQKDTNKNEKNDKNVEEDINIGESPQEKSTDKYENMVNLYNKTCNELPKLIKLTDKRKTAINKLLKEYTLEEIEKGFKMFNESEFCKGINERGWKADFDFCIKPDKMASVLEGKYNNVIKKFPEPAKFNNLKEQKPNKFHNFMQHDEIDLEAIARQKFEKKMNELRGNK